MAIRVKNKINERNIIEFIRRHIILIAFFVGFLGIKF